MTHKLSPLTPAGDGLYPIATERQRLQIDLRDPRLMPKLKDQAAASNQSLTTLVNNVLEHFLTQPTVFSSHLVENLELMFELFESMPMERIRQLAQVSHRSPNQMLIHLLMKGLTAYSTLDGADQD